MDPLGMSKSSQNTPVSKRKEPNAGAENGKSKVRKTRFGEEDDEDDKGENSAKKQRLVWNPDLKSKFTAAVNALGKNDARPKTILNMMDVPDLTQRQVASHLQKYKAQAQPLPESKFPLTSLLLGNQINDSGPALPMRENSSLLQSRSLQNRAHNSSSFRQFRSSSQRLQINNARVQAGSSRPWLQNSNSVLQPGSPALAMPGNNSVLQPESPMLAMQGNNPVRRPGSASSLNLQNNISMLQSGSSGNMQHNISLLQPGFPFRWQQTDVPMLHPGANENYLMHINNSLLQIGSSFNNVQNNASRMQVGSSFGVQTHTSILQPGSSLNWVQNNLPMFQRTPSFNFWGNNKLLQCESLLDEPDEDLLLYHGPLPQWLQETLLVLRQGSSSSSHGFQNYISILQPGFSSHSMNWVPIQLGGGNSGLPSGGNTIQTRFSHPIVK
ncbi:two-component response regulator ARR10-like [Carica papaya]|uniref:two-component response regulator ARR10-like n=1 Tax=Carica papaya TaxID=3649 RepID=UPI000B8CE400|nr:two-component response regulator ARR10-like [Carica papaya]